jgi:tRNA threonylcarbamoyladenosine biosynthesis protein TsaE
MTTHLPDEQATMRHGRALADTLRAGDVLALVGDLGAGKTHLTKGIVAGLGSPEEVTSPTFTLVHEYRAGRLPVFHLDFYRMKTQAEVLAIGWDEYLDERGVVIVEWPELHAELLPAHTRWFRLETLAVGGRNLIEAK